jgi:hypothetical protein
VFSISGGVLAISIGMALFEGELASLVEFCACFYLPWFHGGVWFLPLRKPVFWLLPS